MKIFYILFFSFFISIPGFSQSVILPSIKTDTLNEVDINDNSKSIRIQEESLNLEIVNSAFIQRHLGGSLMKTLERLPGIKTIGIGSGQSKPLIRGLGFNRVVVVEKGIKHEGQQWGADHGLELDQFAVGDVELIKGAASFIYGSDAIGGVINTKPQIVPSEHSLSGSVNLIGKSNNHLFGTSANLSGRQKHWFFDSRYTYQDYGDYRVPADRVYVYDYAVNLHNQQLRNTAGRENAIHFSTGYLGRDWRSVFYLSNVYSKSGFFANAHGLEPRSVDEPFHDASSRDLQKPYQEVNHLKLINSTTYRWNRHKFELEAGFQHNLRQEYSQYVNHGYMPSVLPDSLNISSDLERQFDKKIYSLNLRDEISLGGHDFTIGINSDYQDNTIGGWTFLVPAFWQTTAGIFLYDKYKLSDRMVLHAAMRYDHSKIRMYNYTDWFVSGPAEGEAGSGDKLTRAADLKRNFNSVVWSAGLNYNLDEFALKANIGKSFRMPIAKELGANGVNYHYFSYERGNANLSPEKSYQADLSLSWTTSQWSMQVSPFFNYFSNYIYLNPTAEHDYYYGAGNQVFRYAQSKVMRYGGEMTVKYSFRKSLSMEFLAEYLHARQLSGDKKGYTLPFSPPASGLLNLTWSPKSSLKLKDSYFSIDYRLVAAQFNIVPPEKKTPGYGLLNLQAGSTFPFGQRSIMLSIQAQNLLDTRYLNHTSFYRLIELPEQGRNIILSIKYLFNLKKITH